MLSHGIDSINRRWHSLAWERKVHTSARKTRKNPIKDGLVLFDTSIKSLNMGDVIIRYYCNKVIKEIFPSKESICIPTHVLPSEEEINGILGIKAKIVCGTNLITPHYEEFSNWKMPNDLYGYQNIITLGVGWGYYCKEISRKSRVVYNTILSKTGMHSVRDSYTEHKFYEMGIRNVVNTGCPTLWGLTEEHCASIPMGKTKKVITTITDYDRDPCNDRLMLEILLKEYESVLVWIQGTEDYEYLKELIDVSLVEVVPRDFEAYTDVLCQEDIDYVGTRLHAGIHALNCGRRSLIIAIDNRAIEMGKDFGLPMIHRESIKMELKERIYESRLTKIKLPFENIKNWKQQFIKN